MTKYRVVQDFTFKWNGAHTVNVYDDHGNNIDCFSVGDFAKDRATDWAVRRGIENWLVGRGIIDTLWEDE